MTAMQISPCRLFSVHPARGRANFPKSHLGGVPLPAKTIFGFGATAIPDWVPVGARLENLWETVVPGTIVVQALNP